MAASSSTRNTGLSATTQESVATSVSGVISTTSAAQGTTESEAPTTTVLATTSLLSQRPTTAVAPSTRPVTTPKEVVTTSPGASTTAAAPSTRPVTTPKEVVTTSLATTSVISTTSVAPGTTKASTTVALATTIPMSHRSTTATAPTTRPVTTSEAVMTTSAVCEMNLDEVEQLTTTRSTSDNVNNPDSTKLNSEDPWYPSNLQEEPNPFVDIEFETPVSVRALQVQGNGPDAVTTMQLFYKEPNDLVLTRWEKVLTVPYFEDNSIPVAFELPEDFPVVEAIRIQISLYDDSVPTLRVGVFGCLHEVTTVLPTEATTSVISTTSVAPGTTKASTTVALATTIPMSHRSTTATAPTTRPVTTSEAVMTTSAVCEMNLDEVEQLTTTRSTSDNVNNPDSTKLNSEDPWYPSNLQEEPNPFVDIEFETPVSVRALQVQGNGPDAVTTMQLFYKEPNDLVLTRWEKVLTVPYFEDNSIPVAFELPEDFPVVEAIRIQISLYDDSVPTLRVGVFGCLHEVTTVLPTEATTSVISTTSVAPGTTKASTTVALATTIPMSHRSTTATAPTTRPVTTSEAVMTTSAVCEMNLDEVEQLTTTRSTSDNVNNPDSTKLNSEEPWYPSNLQEEPNPFVDIEFETPVSVRALQVQGNGPDAVTTMQLFYKEPSDLLLTRWEKVLTVPYFEDNSIPVAFELPEDFPIVEAIRIQISLYDDSVPTLRVGVFGCLHEVTTVLPTEATTSVISTTSVAPGTTKASTTVALATTIPLSHRSTTAAAPTTRPVTTSEAVMTTIHACRDNIGMNVGVETTRSTSDNQSPSLTEIDSINPWSPNIFGVENAWLEFTFTDNVKPASIVIQGEDDNVITRFRVDLRRVGASDFTESQQVFDIVPTADNSGKIETFMPNLPLVTGLRIVILDYVGTLTLRATVYGCHLEATTTPRIIQATTGILSGEITTKPLPTFKPPTEAPSQTTGPAQPSTTPVEGQTTTVGATTTARIIQATTGILSGERTTKPLPTFRSPTEAPRQTTGPAQPSTTPVVEQTTTVGATTTARIFQATTGILSGERTTKPLLTFEPPIATATPKTPGVPSTTVAPGMTTTSVVSTMPQTTGSPPSISTTNLPPKPETTGHVCREVLPLSEDTPPELFFDSEMINGAYGWQPVDSESLTINLISEMMVTGINVLGGGPETDLYAKTIVIYYTNEEVIVPQVFTQNNDQIISANTDSVTPKTIIFDTRVEAKTLIIRILDIEPEKLRLRVEVLGCHKATTSIPVVTEAPTAVPTTPIVTTRGAPPAITTLRSTTTQRITTNRPLVTLTSLPGATTKKSTTPQMPTVSPTGVWTIAGSTSSIELTTAHVTTVAGQPTTTAKQATTIARQATTTSGQATTTAGKATTLAKLPTTIAGQSTTTARQSTTVAGIATTIAGQSTTTARQSTTVAGIATTIAGQSTTTARQSTTVAGIATTIAGQSTTTARQSTTLAKLPTTIAGQSTTTARQSTTVAGIATTIAGQSTTTARQSTTVAGIATTIAGQSTTTARQSTTVAGIATTIAGQATTTARQSTTVAGIATTIAGQATTTARQSTTLAKLPTTIAGQSTTTARQSTTVAGIATTIAGQSTTTARQSTTVAGIATTTAAVTERATTTAARGTTTASNVTSTTGQSTTTYSQTTGMLMTSSIPACTEVVPMLDAPQSLSFDSEPDVNGVYGYTASSGGILTVNLNGTYRITGFNILGGGLGSDAYVDNMLVYYLPEDSDTPVSISSLFITVSDSDSALITIDFSNNSNILSDSFVTSQLSFRIFNSEKECSFLLWKLSFFVEVCKENLDYLESGRELSDGQNGSKSALDDAQPWYSANGESPLNVIVNFITPVRITAFITQGNQDDVVTMMALDYMPEGESTYRSLNQNFEVIPSDDNSVATEHYLLIQLPAVTSIRINIIDWTNKNSSSPTLRLSLLGCMEAAVTTTAFPAFNATTTAEACYNVIDFAEDTPSNLNLNSLPNEDNSFGWSGADNIEIELSEMVTVSALNIVGGGIGTDQYVEELLIYYYPVGSNSPTAIPERFTGNDDDSTPTMIELPTPVVTSRLLLRFFNINREVRLRLQVLGCAAQVTTLLPTSASISTVSPTTGVTPTTFVTNAMLKSTLQVPVTPRVGRLTTIIPPVCSEILETGPETPESVSFTSPADEIGIYGWAPSDNSTSLTITLDVPKQVSGLNIRGGGSDTDLYAKRIRVYYKTPGSDERLMVSEPEDQVGYEANVNDIVPKTIAFKEVIYASEVIIAFLQSDLENIRVRVELIGCDYEGTTIVTLPRIFTTLRPTTSLPGWTIWSPWSECSSECGIGEIVRSRTCMIPPTQGECEGGIEAGVETEECNSGPCPSECDENLSQVDGLIVTRTTSDNAPVENTLLYTEKQWTPNVAEGQLPTITAHFSTPVILRTLKIIGKVKELSMEYIPEDSEDFIYFPEALQIPADGYDVLQTFLLPESLGEIKAVKLAIISWPESATPYMKVEYFGCFHICEAGDPECSVDCSYGDWTPWTECSKSCGVGGQKRTRSYNPPENGGEECDSPIIISETQSCNTDACPIPGEWSPWTPWSNCTAECEGGEMSRKRTCSNPPPKNGGQYCNGSSEETKTCNVAPCEEECQSPMVYDPICANRCPSRCDQLKQGMECSDEEDCEPGCRCPDGMLADYNGNCVQQSQCECLDENNELWPVGATEKIDCNNCTCMNGRIECTEELCAVDCEWSSWSVWYECTQECGDETKYRYRSGNNPPASNGGKECEGDNQESESCDLEDCPVYCIHEGVIYQGDEVVETKCSECVCRNGFMECTRTCTYVPPEWSRWSSCSVTCGEGSIVRTRSCNETEVGIVCLNGTASETENCTMSPCPVNGEWCEWKPWSNCSEECGMGEIIRQRECGCPEPQYGGEDCDGDDTQTEICYEKYCPVDCEWLEWETWSECTKDCGTEEQFTTRQRLPEQNGGEPCVGAVTKTRMCEIPACPVCEEPLVFRDCLNECELSCVDLSSTSECANDNAECVYGCGCPEGTVMQDGECVKPEECRCVVDIQDIYNQLPSITTPSGSNPLSGYEVEAGMNITLDCAYCECKSGDLKCSEIECKVPGGWSNWEPWSDCNVSCGTEPGTVVRYRSCTNPSPNPPVEDGGIGCEGIPMQTSQCPTRSPCPIDCVFAEWNPWSPCSAACNGGHRSRWRGIEQYDLFGGKPCNGVLSVIEHCNTHLCPGEDCESRGMVFDFCANECQTTCLEKSQGIECVQEDFCLSGCKCPEGEYMQDGFCVPVEECYCNMDMTILQKVIEENKEVTPVLPSKPKSEEYFIFEFPEDCLEPLDMPADIPEEILPEGEGWSGEFITITYEEEKFITKLAISGAGPSTNAYMERLVIVYKEKNADNLQTLRGQDGTPLIFNANVDDSTTVEVPLPFGGLRAQSISIVPLVSPDHPAKLRMSILGCTYTGQEPPALTPVPVGGVTNRPAPSPTTSLPLPVPTGSGPEGVFLPGEMLHFNCLNCTCEDGALNCVDDDCAYMTEWSEWTICSATCNAGVQIRERICIGESADNPCPGEEMDERHCNINPCPVDCIYSEWSDWSDCPVTCDSGEMHKSREILIPDMFNGVPCTEPLTATKHCNMDPCTICEAPLVESDCANICPTTCGDMHDGNSCQQEECVPGCRCPAAMVLQDGECVEPTECRCVVEPSVFGGSPLTLLDEEYVPGTVIQHKCNNCTCEMGGFVCGDEDCDVDCGWSNWSDWSECSTNCGSGRRAATRTPNNPARQYGGEECHGEDIKEEECYAGDCICEDNEVFNRYTKDCMIQSCRNYASNEELECDGETYEACICDVGYYLNEDGECVPPHECECVHEGTVHEAGDIWKTDNCTECSCKNGEVECYSYCEVPLCESGYELVVKEGECCPVCEKTYEPEDSCHLAIEPRNVTNSRGCRADDVSIPVCIGRCQMSSEIILDSPNTSGCRCCQGYIDAPLRDDDGNERPTYDIIKLTCPNGELEDGAIPLYTGCTCDHPCQSGP
ncbi:uncharacterized protein [Antedon mediterranea]|uniref:uncharacterized protein n=1 Tax=Antedon mediterranea TaxID=105859 RepID=UPI003AF6AF72